jgi:hypothetical protein
MKICPSCRQTYTDDNLNFCLTDGSFLTNAADTEPKTILMDQPRITNQTNWDQQNFQPPSVWDTPQNIQQSQVNYPMRIQSQSQVLPTISLICGILGLLTFCCHGGLPLGIAAVVTGVVGINQEKNDPANYGGRGLALGGIITGAVCILIGIGWMILALIGSIS